MHLALGGCLKAPPVRYGITADTGGHIAYVLSSATAQADLPCVSQVSIVTRLFDDAMLGVEHGQACERLGDHVTIDRIATDRRDYLEKEALASDLAAFTDAFCDHLRRLPRLPDVIHVHFSDAASVALAARRYFKIPLVYTPHALGIDKRAQQLPCAILDQRIAAERRVIASADAIVVSTSDEAERQIEAYGVATAATRTVCLSPGVPPRPPQNGLAVLPRQVARALHAPEKPIVLAIARPVRKKNLGRLVRAFIQTPALYERANLVILAGQHDGRLSSEEREVIGDLARLCAQDCLAGRVALPRRHDSADVSALYQKAALGGVFVNPALHEPFGLTLIEAAAAGVPVVATRNGGPAEIVETIGHGLLVDPRDESAIGRTCLKIIADTDLHHGFTRKALSNVARYDWVDYATRSVSLYASLCRPGLVIAAGAGSSFSPSARVALPDDGIPLAEHKRRQNARLPGDQAEAA